MKTRWYALAILISGSILILSAGCFLRGAADEPGNSAAAAQHPAAAGETAGKNASEVKNEIVRRLLEKLDDTDADPESIRTVRKMLMEADQELSAALADNGRSPKPTATPPRPQAPAGTAPVDRDDPAAPGDRAQGAVPPNSPKQAKAKTPIVAALLTVLDEIAAADKDAEDVVRDALTQADAQLSTILGASSKERILRANQKPPIRVPLEPKRRSPAKTDNDRDAGSKNRGASPRS